MGHRLTKIYTRTGDKGSTGLADGSRVDKDSPRIEAIGEIDELNSFVGAILVHDLPVEIRECCIRIQHALFDLGGELAVPGTAVIDHSYTAGLEQILDDFNETLPPLKEFILPGGGPAAIACHLARAVCRRVERRLVGLARLETVNEESRKYINRLSDLLFVFARVLARNNSGEVFWKPGRHRPPAEKG
jgi:cob(I)alamin adenosyltransferase